MGNRSGMALVLALMAISFLTAVTVQLFHTVNWQVRSSANFRDSVRIDAMNRSVLSIARASLLADSRLNDYDSHYDDWNRLDAKDLPALLGSSNVDLSVSDLSGRIQVNALVSREKDRTKRLKQERFHYNLWLRFLLSGRFAVVDEQQAVALIDSIIDWIDRDKDERDHGAEDGYYLALADPYQPRNGPVKSLDELLLIRGMTPDIFYGNEESSGISEYLTEFGDDGKININSAPAPVLAALAEGIDDEMAQALIAFREDENNRDLLANPGWFAEVSGFPGDIVLEDTFITVRSSYFLVNSTVEMNEFSRTGRAALQRQENGAQKLLRWDVD
jgi:general secretion pathway protein K